MTKEELDFLEEARKKGIDVTTVRLMRYHAAADVAVHLGIGLEYALKKYVDKNPFYVELVKIAS